MIHMIHNSSSKLISTNNLVLMLAACSTLLLMQRFVAATSSFQDQLDTTARSDPRGGTALMARNSASSAIDVLQTTDDEDACLLNYGATITNAKGELQSMSDRTKIPFLVDTTYICMYMIAVSNAVSITFEFTSWDMSPDEGVIIYTDSSLPRNDIVLYPTASAPPSIQNLEGQWFFVEWHASNTYNNGKGFSGFKINYTVQVAAGDVSSSNESAPDDDSTSGGRELGAGPKGENANKNANSANGVVAFLVLFGIAIAALSVIAVYTMSQRDARSGRQLPSREPQDNLDMTVNASSPEISTGAAVLQRPSNGGMLLHVGKDGGIRYFGSNCVVLKPTMNAAASAAQHSVRDTIPYMGENTRGHKHPSAAAAQDETTSWTKSGFVLRNGDHYINNYY